MAAKKQEKDTEISVIEVQKGEIEFCVLGITPLILNRMSQKVLHELLLPKGRKTAADKASSLKHNPHEEFRASAHTDPDPKAPTWFCLPSMAFKGAMRSAAIDLPGTAKAQIGRLTYVDAEYCPIWGAAKLHMAVTRNSDMNHTPDVRTRCIIPEWASRIRFSFTRPLLREQAIANLFAAAGIMRGVGDWRVEKGSGSFGQFMLVSEDDDNFQRIIRGGGRAAQIASWENPEPYDTEAEEMLSWFSAEANRRGFKVAA